ncbi:hypothetical protein [Mesonia aquimarina]|uniref:hypothetical protein n=1 Tax=Mesonia aquimarina TaxID=1504967 RepID=UPI000EF5CECE|nr:hypothetical protein [Mesonia aquimarina]
MKKILFYLFILVLLYLVITIISMIIEFSSLSNFGYGYFAGNIFLFVFIASIEYWLYKKVYSQKKS